MGPVERRFFNDDKPSGRAGSNGWIRGRGEDRRGPVKSLEKRREKAVSLTG
jgi:hypothetical protein